MSDIKFALMDSAIKVASIHEKTLRYISTTDEAKRMRALNLINKLCNLL